MSIIWYVAVLLVLANGLASAGAISAFRRSRPKGLEAVRHLSSCALARQALHPTLS